MKPATKGHRVAIAAMGVFWGLSCGVPYRSTDTAPQSRELKHEVRALLIAELRRLASVHPHPDSTNTRFINDSSAVVPGLTYHWGVYSPRLRPEVLFTALAAERKGEVTLITAPGDWIDATKGFTPRSSDDLLGACREMIASGTVPRSPRGPMVLFTDRESVNQLPLPVPDAEYLRTNLSPPEVSGDSATGWQARFWIVQRRFVRQYECRLGKNSGLAVIDSLPGYGFY